MVKYDVRNAGGVSLVDDLLSTRDDALQVARQIEFEQELEDHEIEVVVVQVDCDEDDE